MKNIFSLFLLITISSKSFCQSTFGKKEFIYGTMVGSSDTLVGYFWFDNQINQFGQTVHFKKDLNSGKKKVFQSHKYKFFQNDSIYLETFVTEPNATGELRFMLPRIINGKIQLFESKYKWGYFNMFTSERFYIKAPGEKAQVKKKNFKQLMKRVLADDEDLVKKIDNNELQFDDLPEIVTKYNSRHLLD